MSGIDHPSAGARPALLSRLQSTMPSDLGREESSLFAGRQPGDRLRGHAESSSALKGSYPGPAAVSWTQAASAEIVKQRWTILVVALAGLLGAIFYTVQFCTPLYQIQASIEVQGQGGGSRTEALAYILTSQSLINVAFSSLPETARVMLVESTRGSNGPASARRKLRDRIQAVAISSAQVVDITFVTPNRAAGVDFVNQLVQKLIQRDLEQHELSDASNGAERNRESISIIDPAVPSLNTVSPNIFLNTLTGLLAGTFAALAFVLIRQFVANPFGGPGSVARVLGLRELGAVPERKLLTAGSEEFTTVALDANEESLRYLRSSLLYQPGKRELRCLAFTSAAPGEGKTTVVSNLSMSLAATGRRVLVIDGDLRRPRLYKLLQVAQGPGLADLLRRDPNGPPAPLSRFVYATSFQNLYVLPPGTAGDDAPELLAGQNLRQLIREISRSFDFILIDTPPLLACADARNYAQAAEGVVLVVRSSETRKRAALAARDMMLQDGANIIGTVLTGWRQTYPTYRYSNADSNLPA